MRYNILVVLGIGIGICNCTNYFLSVQCTALAAHWKTINSVGQVGVVTTSTVSCQKALSNILTFVQERQKTDFKQLSFLLTYVKMNNNSPPHHQCVKLQCL